MAFLLLICIACSVGCAVHKTLLIKSEPEGITVSKGGGVIGTTPFSITVGAGDIFFCSPWYWSFDLEAGSQVKRIDPCNLADGSTVMFYFPEYSNQKSNEPPKNAAKTGTGFLISRDGYIVTSYHVIEGAANISVSIGGASFPAALKSFSKGTDIAVIKIDYNPQQFISVESDSMLLGEEVFTVGFPFPDLLGKNSKFSNGTISSLTGIQGDNSLFQISVPIQPGNSGGPLCNKKGHVIGIITSTAAVEYFYSKTGAIPQNVNWATKTEYIKPLLGGINIDSGKKELTVKQVTECVVYIAAE